MREKRLGDAKRTLMQKKDAVKIKDDIIASKGNPQEGTGRAGKKRLNPRKS